MCSLGVDCTLSTTQEKKRQQYLRPHFFKLEFLDTGFIGSDGGALDAHAVFLDSLGSLYCDLIIGCITVLNG